MSHRLYPAETRGASEAGTDDAKPIEENLQIVAVGLTIDRILFAPLEKWAHKRWGLDRA